ncbi:DUF2612 domain-containing protein [Desulfosporosinus sp. PR]|uniref:DUF2612 domain-containing protein n=1 Tax=Candidatus Desulfosporosinus nitrosoreducens TaxID=3401928 RepID=UPI0027F8B570|nr:DUF2612 domain-containing protein [Desulfosporosinus sp. PR]MDQ7094228.1 DUF2612 domain-containing protein [Desulfosporosinus sp. PR]
MKYGQAKYGAFKYGTEVEFAQDKFPDIQRYLNLITSEHQNKPKLAAWLAAPLSILDDGTSLANNLSTYFDIDTAVGVQLDMLGDIVGIKRTVNFQPTDGSSPVLDDTTYRLVLHAKILRNMWDGTLPSLYTMWDILFTDAYLIVRDNQNMTMDAFIIGLSSQLQKDLTTNGYLIPKPQGVQIYCSYSDTALFAFGVESTDLKGFDEGTWSSIF